MLGREVKSVLFLQPTGKLGTLKPDQQHAATNGSTQPEATATPQPSGVGSPHPQYIYPKTELDPQNAR